MDGILFLLCAIVVLSYLGFGIWLSAQISDASNDIFGIMFMIFWILIPLSALIQLSA